MNCSNSPFPFDGGRGPAAGARGHRLATHPRTSASTGVSEWVTLSVGDTGGGIPQEIVDEVFDPFFTTKEAGPGRASRSCVASLRRGGRVEVRNGPGEGVTFCLWLRRTLL